MGLIFCIYCGTHDVCPSEMGGNLTCDVCGKDGLVPCGECDACRAEYGMEDNCEHGDDFEEFESYQD